MGVLGLAALAMFVQPARFRTGSGQDNPLELKPRQWRSVVVGAVKEFQDDRAQEVAAGVTFYALLSMFPAIAAFVSLYGLFADPAQVAGHVAALTGVLPGDIVGFVAGEMDRLAHGQKGGLGLAFAAGLVLSLWSANAGVKALFSGLNIAYEVREHRGFFTLNLVSLLFTAGALVLASLALAAANAAPLALWVLLPAWAGQLASIVVMLVVLMIALSAVYRYGPCRAHVRWRWVTPGSIVAIMAWFGVSFAFSWYARHLGHYDRTYGSLGAVIAFMVWLWLSMTVLLFGAELNAEVELHTKGLPADETRDPAHPPRRS